VALGVTLLPMLDGPTGAVRVPYRSFVHYQ